MTSKNTWVSLEFICRWNSFCRSHRVHRSGLVGLLGISFTNKHGRLEKITIFVKKRCIFKRLFFSLSCSFSGMYIPFLKLTATGPKKLMVGRLRFSLEKTYFSGIWYDSFRESRPQFSPTTNSWCMEGNDFLAWVLGRVQKGFFRSGKILICII